MLSKLMKYEWKNLSRQFLIMLAVLVGTTLISSLMVVSINFDFDQVNNSYSLFMLIGSILIYYLGLIVCSFGTSLIIAIRFYKSCYTDEGYLTHTLPVSARQLVGAKTLSACLIQLLCMVSILLSLIIYGAVIIAAVVNSGSAHYAGSFSLALINTEFQQELGIGLVQYCAFMLIYCIIGCITGPSIILGCVSLGQFYTRHRILGAILAYFIVTMIKQFVTYIAMLPTYSKLIIASASGKTLPMMSIMMPTFIIVFVITIIIAIAMYFINIHMMTSKLNLE